jgi:ABC-type transporter Mla maintaining outer membrane lipid asymmetry ATPase subunit MlaF
MTPSRFGALRRADDERGQMTIQVENLAKSFGPVPVLSAVTETFEDGSISVLLGASGCGKTTMLRCVAGQAHGWCCRSVRGVTPETR